MKIADLPPDYRRHLAHEIDWLCYVIGAIGAARVGLGLFTDRPGEWPSAAFFFGVLLGFVIYRLIHLKEPKRLPFLGARTDASETILGHRGLFHLLALILAAGLVYPVLGWALELTSPFGLAMSLAAASFPAGYVALRFASMPLRVAWMVRSEYRFDRMANAEGDEH